MDRRQELTEMAYRFLDWANEERVKEGKEPLTKEKMDQLVREFVEGNLALEAEAKQKENG